MPSYRGKLSERITFPFLFLIVEDMKITSKFLFAFGISFIIIGLGFVFYKDNKGLFNKPLPIPTEKKETIPTKVSTTSTRLSKDHKVIILVGGIPIKSGISFDSLGGLMVSKVEFDFLQTQGLLIDSVYAPSLNFAGCVIDKTRIFIGDSTMIGSDILRNFGSVLFDFKNNVIRVYEGL